VINAADVQVKYLDNNSVEKLISYFQTGELRVRAAASIAANAAGIIKETSEIFVILRYHSSRWKYVYHL
jgi:hypothetical protein